MKKIVNFIAETKKEIGKISWINRKEAAVSTVSVFIIVFFFAIFFLCVDLLLSNFITFILR